MRTRLLLGVLLLALALPGAAAADARSLYLVDCASCHGVTLEGVDPQDEVKGTRGVEGAGPSLRGMGALAVDFVLRTGYMPLRDPYAQPMPSSPTYTDAQIRGLARYVGSYGGPGIPKPHPERGNVAEGLRLFTEDCSGCHQVLGKGGVVANRVAPSLDRDSAVQIAEAVRLGPYVMPRFDERRLSPRQLDSVVAYVLSARHPKDEGGWALGHLGPVPEGMVAWLLAGAVLVLVTRLIGEARKS
jgi:ubiquinol-cytochrome c reductase cytochrome c subunit